jgi:ATP/maltotriose-dependent transcriptional regulator MalT
MGISSCRHEGDRGEVATAARQFHEALRLATQSRLIALERSLMLSIADLLVQAGDRDLRQDVVRSVQYAGASHAVQQRARQLLADESAARLVIDPEAMPDDATLLARLQAHLAVLGQQQATSQPARRPADGSSSPLVEPLSAREREILRLLVAGQSYQEIAASLTLAVGSVKSHAHNIYAKLGVRNRMQAAARATELDLL